VKDVTPVSTDTALRIAKVFGTNPEFWLTLLSQNDIRIAEEEMAAEVARIETRD